MVERPRIPWRCDNPSSPYYPGVTCGCLCHHLTPADLAEVDRLGKLQDKAAVIYELLHEIDDTRKEEAMSARPDDTCPKCGEALLYDEVDIGVGIQYSAPGCSDQECGWEPTPYELPPRQDEQEARDATHT